jgi:probable phosphoglycerate mutase
VSETLPLLYIARHAETAWSLDGRHTGRTDLPLTERGEENARKLGARLRGMTFGKVFTSPLQRAKRTCELAGLGSVADIDSDLVEWDYGEYEGKRSLEIRAGRPDWELFRDGCPGGESPQRISERADRFLNRVRSADGEVLAFTSGHISRVLAARWLGVELWPIGKLLMLGTASLSALGYDRDRTRPALHLWNETHHLE